MTSGTCVTPVPPAPTPAPIPGKVCTIIPGDVTGSLFPGPNAHTVDSTAEWCKAACESDGDCGCYAFDPSRDRGSCWLKKEPCGDPQVWSETGDMTSGTCVTPVPPAPTPAPIPGKVCTIIPGDVTGSLVPGPNAHTVDST